LVVLSGTDEIVLGAEGVVVIETKRKRQKYRLNLNTAQSLCEKVRKKQLRLSHRNKIGAFRTGTEAGFQ
jgi:hypothetical protein